MRVKYSRTLHVPWSEGVQSDDIRLVDTSVFEGMDVVVTEKLDGENSSLYRDGSHARSLDSRHHSSRDWLKQFHSTFAADIPEAWRVCGENMFARHSVAYDNLRSYFYGFSIWDANNNALSWDDTLVWFDLLGIEPVPQLYRGVFDTKKIQALWDPKRADSTEGYVIRNAGAFAYDDFSRNVAKFVRKNHVQTEDHWMHGEITPNGLMGP